MSNIAKYKRSIRKLTLISNEVTYVFLRGYMRPKCVLTIFCVKKKSTLLNTRCTVYNYTHLHNIHYLSGNAPLKNHLFYIQTKKIT